MGFKKTFEEYKDKRRDAKRIAKLSEIGYVLLNKDSKLIDVKMFKPSLKKEQKHISKVTRLYEEALQFVEYFQDKYKVDFDDSDISMLKSISLDSLKDCKLVCELAIELSSQARKKSLLVAIHIGFIYLTPLEMILL